MVPRILRWAYGKLGPKYPRVILAGQFSMAHVVTVGGMGLLLLYQSMSGGEFLRLLAAAQLMVLVDNVFATHQVFRMLRPVDRWLRGERDGDTSVAAWRCLVELPVEFVRRRKLYPLLGTGLPWCFYAVWELDLATLAVPILLVGCAVVLLYGHVLRFLAMEIALRPVVEDVARSIPDRTELPRAGISLRHRLVALVALINIITGVVVAGLSESGRTDLSDLGLDVAVAVAVALTLSLELTVMLTRTIVGPIDNLRAATREVGQGNLDVRVPVLSTDETGALSRAFNDAVTGLAERERLREAFGTFVDPEIAERVAQEGSVLEGEEVEVSVLFLDIRDFTALAERSSAREVVTTLNDFYEVVVPILDRHGGHANKYIGDGLLGVFGAPDRRPDHADRAVAAALEILERVHERYGDELRVGIGVNSGPVVAGTVGGGSHLEFTVIGDAVNTAARVESATRETGDELLITEATRCLLERDFGGWEPCRQQVELKGKSEQVLLHAPRAAVGAIRGEGDGDPAERTSAADLQAAGGRD